MGKNSGISWTKSTFNPWWGCIRVSEGCEHCYAELMDARFEKGAEKHAPHWGIGPRRFFGQKHWDEPVYWNKQAQVFNPWTVFCGSMCDVFEGRHDLDVPRAHLFQLILDTPNLTWLLLTKRPENVSEMIPTAWYVDGFPANVWLGTTVETNRYIYRIAEIGDLKVKRFISVEPMLDNVRLDGFWWAIDWLIIGGESGPGCRFFDQNHAAKLVVESYLHKVPCFIKQMGGFPDKQHDILKWPSDLQVQEFPKELRYV